ncbi:MAG: extracellular solute-binding protein, partial [Caldilineae bacterium]
MMVVSVLFVTLLACSLGGSGGTSSSGGVKKPANAIEISIIYAPESKLYLPEAIENFNRSYANGINPLTGEKLGSDEKPIYVTGEPGSSGTIHQGIVNAIIAPNNVNVARPTIFAPSVSHWLALVNYETGRQVFDLSDSPPTALAPVVMAIWESRLEAIKAKNGGQPVGWEELLQVMNAPDGWAGYGIPGDRTTVYYGHTDPYISSTALSTLIAEFYASARYNAGDPNLRRLEMKHVQDPAVQQGVRDIEALIKHYSSRTTEFKEYIAQGPTYLDFVALEENDLIYINQGKTQYKPPEKLVALYPKEGTFWHEHPFGIPYADWVTDEQRAAARIFTEYVRSEEVQRKVLESGFRPVNPNVPIGYPIVPELGVDPNQPATVLDEPEPEVIAAVQASWQYVKKQADILLVMDVSGSMRGSKIDQAREAARAFLDNMPSQNRVGLLQFNQDVNLIVPLASAEGAGANVRQAIDTLQAAGDTALYDAILQAMEVVRQGDDASADRIKAIVVLSDGQDTASFNALNDVITAINAARSDRNPVLVIPVAYGGDADINALNAIARASSTKVQSGDPKDIQKV